MSIAGPDLASDAVPDASAASLPTRLPLHEVASYAVPGRERAGWLRLDINESPEGAPDFVVEATHAALSGQHIATYPTYDAWRRDAAAWFGVPPEWLTCTAGCDEGIKAIFDTYLLPGRALVTQSPGFDMFTLWAGLLGNPVRQVSLRQTAPARLLHDDVAWLQALTPEADQPETGLVALANPNNPAGTAVSRSVIEATLAAVTCPVVIDETYGEFLGESAVDLVARHPHLFVTRSFSKVYGLAGLRIGVVISQPQNIVTLRKVLNPFNVNRAAVAASRACMSRPDHVRDHVASVRAVRDRFAVQLGELGIPTGEAHANFLLAFIGDRHAELVDALEAEGILVRDRHGKHPLMAGCVRIAIGSPAQMTRCLGAIRKVLAPPPPVHTVLLDMDGTLVDVAHSCRQAIIVAANALLGAHLAQQTGVASQPFADTVDAAVVDTYKARGGLNNDWDCVAAILRDRGVDPSRDAIIARYQRSYRGTDFDGSIHTEPWLLSAAAEAKLRRHARVGVVTGRPHDEAQYTLRRHGGPWPVVVGMEDMARQKPAPDGLLAALRALDVDPGSGGVAYVGDSVDDMRAATAAGCLAIGVLAPGCGWGSAWPERLYEAGATAVFSHIDEVVTWLTR